MKTSPIAVAAMAMFLGCTLPAAPAAAAEPTVSTSDSYAIQPGDVLEISVWKETDLQREVLVRPDGGMSFPLVGDIRAAGLTPSELREEIAKRLEKYIPSPVVSVSAKALNGNVVYVIGKANKPGAFVANRYMDVMQALSVAGGMNTFAAVNDIKILRRVNGKVVAYPFRYADIEKGRNLEQNIILQSGDIVVVP